MKQSYGRNGKFSDLRTRAQVFLTQNKDSTAAMSPEDIKNLVHELDTYQIELELQNEDLRQAQDDLAKSRKRFSDLFDFAPIGYLTISNKGLIVECNLTAAEMLGEHKRRLLQQPLTRFIDKEEQDIFYGHRQNLLDSQNAQNHQTCELRMKNNDGGLFYAHMESTLSPDVDDETCQFRVCITDISERRQLEELLQKKREEEWEKAFDGLADIVVIQDSQMKIIRANKAAYDFLKVKPGELIGKKCFEVFSGFSVPCLGCPDLETLLGEDNYSVVITHDKLGKVFHVSTTAITYGNKIDCIIQIAKDITKQKKLEEKLVQAHKMEALGNLAGGIAHDFNNILMAIIGYAELTELNIPDDSPVRENIHQIITSGRRAADLVRSMLTYSRKTESTLHLIAPYLIVEEVLKMFRSSLPTTINIREEIDKESGHILADPTNIHQIIMNLLTNAKHAMEDQEGTLTIRVYSKEIAAGKIQETTRETDSFVVLSVSDTGCGMDQATIDRIFDPYFTTKKTGRGTGLGLAVIHAIVQKLKGFIQVESVLGGGATFDVYLPNFAKAISDYEESASERSETKKYSPSGNERILVVDDEHMLVEIYKTQLEKNGYSVTTATDSREALNVFREQPGGFDLLISDLTMPGLSGFGLSQAVHQVRPSMPIIMCSGHKDLVSQEDAQTLGIKKFISKPLVRKDLLAAVREVLDEN